MSQPTSDRRGTAQPSSDRTALRIDTCVFETLSDPASTDEADEESLVSRWLETWSAGLD